MITLFLSYLYQSVKKSAGSVEIARKEVSHSDVTRRVSNFKIIFYRSQSCLLLYNA